jgi:hypothetical protein
VTGPPPALRSEVSSLEAAVSDYPFLSPEKYVMYLLARIFTLLIRN